VLPTAAWYDLARTSTTARDVRVWWDIHEQVYGQLVKYTRMDGYSTGRKRKRWMCTMPWYHFHTISHSTTTTTPRDQHWTRSSHSAITIRKSHCPEHRSANWSRRVLFPIAAPPLRQIPQLRPHPAPWDLSMPGQIYSTHSDASPIYLSIYCDTPTSAHAATKPRNSYVR